ncbi:MAG: ANTAR domain-containing response regulator [Burkholderiales bacterium]
MNIDQGRDGADIRPAAASAPDQRGSSSPSTTHADPAEHRTSKEQAHILVVDDDRLVRMSVAAALRDAGYLVSVAGDSEEAIRLANAQPAPDLIILDIRIPGIGGLDVARYMNEHTAVPFVIFSAFGESDLVDAASAAGAIAYLVKPLDPAQLIPAIRAALDRSREIKKLRESAVSLRGVLDDREASAMLVGVLMERFAIDREAAFDLLRSQARRERKKVRDLAEELLTSSERMNRLASALARKDK